RGGAASSYGSHADRITKVVAKLDSAKKTYVLGKTTQCPTVFNGGADQHWRMQLDVDFDSMKEGGIPDPGTGSVTKQFTDQATGISVAVSTSDAALAAKLKQASLAVQAHEGGSSHDSVRDALVKAFLKRYISEPSFDAYTVALKNPDGSELDVSGSNIILTIPSSFKYADTYKLVGDSLGSVSSFYRQGNVIATDSSLGTYAVADHYSASYWVDFDFADESLDATGRMRVSSAQTGVEGYKGILSFHMGSEDEAGSSKAYTLGVMLSYDDQPDDVLPFWWDEDAYLTMTVPVEHEGDAVFLVRSDGTKKTVQALGSSVADGKATVDILSPGSMTQDEAQELLVELYNAWKNGIDSGTAAAPVAYLSVVSEGGTTAAQPYVKSGLMYAGQAQTGVIVDPNCTVTGTVEATDAGTYEAEVTPKDGYAWPDGTASTQKVTWSIGKSPLGFYSKGSSSNSEYIAYDAQPTYRYGTVFGYKGSDTAESIGFKPIEVKPSARLSSVEPDGRYTFDKKDMIGLDQTFTNYTLENQGTFYLVVGMHPDNEPKAVEGLTYTGKAQTGVTGDTSRYTLTNVKQTKAGTYTAIAKLDKPYTNYAWSDGTRDDRTITWSIAPATLTAAYEGDEVKTDRNEAKGIVSVSGFVNGETADSVKGFALPTVTIPNALQAGRQYQLTPSGGVAGDNYVFSYVAGTLKVGSGYAPKKLEAGTYTVTANLWMPGKYNPVLPGVNVYANNPDNPFGPVLDENTQDGTIKNVPPTAPLQQNATLVVGKDGTRTLILPVLNPVFTLQELGVNGELSQVKVERVTPTDPKTWTFGAYSSRIHKIAVQLPADAEGDELSYVFTDSTLYAVPLDLKIKPASGTPALQLDVRLVDAKRVSDSTVVPTLVDLVKK
ncbi:MAG: MBG domain-containing protein, partial [Slackia sp.]|nr:MBG domain-containing protein [Slackia sp.]